MKKYMVALALITAVSILANVQEINSEKEFNDTIAHGVSVVKFYAPGCPNCEGARHSFEQASKALPSIHFISVNGHDYPSLKEKYRVQGYPAFIYFKDGRYLEANRHTGMTDGLKSKIEAVVAGIK